MKTFHPEKICQIGLLFLATLILSLNSCSSTQPATYIVQDGKIKVFSSTFIDHYEELTIADVESFKILNETYAKDKQNVYLGFNIVTGADVESFSAISGNIGRDSVRYYYYSSPLSINLTGRTIVDFNRFYWTDGESVYYKTEKIAELESTHRVVSDPIFENGVHVFYKNKKLEGLRVGSYKVYDYDYLLGDQAVYYQDLKVAVDNPKSFRLLQDYGSGKFFTDGLHIYSNWTKLRSADPTTFICLDHGFAKDKKHVYSGHFIVKGADPDTFSMVFGMAYGRDKNGIVTDNKSENVESDAM